MRDLRYKLIYWLVKLIYWLDPNKHIEPNGTVLRTESNKRLRLTEEDMIELIKYNLDRMTYSPLSTVDNIHFALNAWRAAYQVKQNEFRKEQYDRSIRGVNHLIACRLRAIVEQAPVEPEIKVQADNLITKLFDESIEKGRLLKLPLGK
jgi:hypothetical protein